MMHITNTAPATYSTVQPVTHSQILKPLDAQSIGESIGESISEDTRSITSSTTPLMTHTTPENRVSRITNLRQSKSYKAFKGKARASLIRKGDSLALLAGLDTASKILRTDSKLACTLKLGDTSFSKQRTEQLLYTRDTKKNIEDQQKDFNRVLSDIKHGLAHNKNLKYDSHNESVLSTMITGLAQHPEYLNSKLLINSFSTLLEIAKTLQNTGEAYAAHKAIDLCKEAFLQSHDPLKSSRQSIKIAEFMLKLHDTQDAAYYVDQASKAAQRIDYPTEKISRLKEKQEKLSAMTNNFFAKHDLSGESHQYFMALDDVNAALKHAQTADYNEIKLSTLRQVAALRIKISDQNSVI